jgi:PKD domain
VIVRSTACALAGGVVLVLLGACSTGTQVEGVKFTATPSLSAAALQPTEQGGLAVRLVPPATTASVGQEVTLDVEYADGHGGLVGTVEDFGDGGIGGMKVSDCRESESNPSSGTKQLRHAWAAPGTYRVSVTVTTLSCVHGQEDVTATAEVVVR